ncbi:winged helix-turn-helix domain-containing protein [Paraglaciecola aestuariivivens]
MSEIIEVSQAQAKHLALAGQGLREHSASYTGLQGCLNVIQQLSYVQIDSISVVQRAHHHVLFNRVGCYQPDYLNQLIQNKSIFEYWSHAAAYLPMQDFRFSLPKKLAIASGQKHWRENNPKIEKQVLLRIAEEGPLRAQDFAENNKKHEAGWWQHKPEKHALEQLFIEGKLMVCHRQGIQKVFDLTERVLPAGLDTSMPSEDEMNRYLVTRYLGAHTLANIEQMGYLRKGVKAKLKQTVAQMLENGQLLTVKVANDDYYALPNVTDLLDKKHTAKGLFILSPFDNLVIQRKRLSRLWDFDYQIECYLPAAKRQFGYFSLPLLWGTNFIGRVDAKVDRKTKCLHLNHLHFNAKVSEELLLAWQQALQEFKQFNQAESVILHKVTGATKSSVSAFL